jgi:thiol:disulfide interchange protein
MDSDFNTQSENKQRKCLCTVLNIVEQYYMYRSKTLLKDRKIKLLNNFMYGKHKKHKHINKCRDLK